MYLTHIGAYHLVDLIRKDKSLKVLDIGPGYGYWAYTLRANLEHEPTFIGVEINPGCIERLRRFPKLYKAVVRGDASEIPSHLWDSETYDLAILSYVVEHMEKEMVIKLLSNLKAICDQIIVLCSEGDDRFDHDEIGHSHISIWKKRDFEKIGMNIKHIAISNRAGRAVSLFERIYFKLKGLKRGGVLLAWWDNARAPEDLAEIMKEPSKRSPDRSVALQALNTPNV